MVRKTKPKGKSTQLACQKLWNRIGEKLQLAGRLIPPAARKHLHDIRIIFHIIHRNIAHTVICGVNVEILDDFIDFASSDIFSASKRDLLYGTAAELVIYTDGVVFAVF